MEEKTCTKCRQTQSIDEFYSYLKNSKRRGEYVHFLPECKSCLKKRAVNWGINNREKKNASQRKNNKKPKTKEIWRLNQKKKIESGKYREWQQANPEKIKSYNLHRKQNRNHTISVTEWNSCKKYFSNSCAYCGMTYIDHKTIFHQDLHKEHVDHEGKGDLSNCVPSCKPCNSEKNTKLFIDWYTPSNKKFSEDRLNKITSWLNTDHVQYLKTRKSKGA